MEIWILGWVQLGKIMKEVMQLRNTFQNLAHDIMNSHDVMDAWFF